MFSLEMANVQFSSATHCFYNCNIFLNLNRGELYI